MAKSSKHPIVVSSRAANLLFMHTEFISRVSIQAARKLHEEYKKAIRNIAEMPARYPYLEEEGIPPKLYRTCLFYGRYQIVFLEMDGLIYIDVVRDCRQDPDGWRP